MLVQCNAVRVMCRCGDLIVLYSIQCCSENCDGIYSNDKCIHAQYSIIHPHSETLIIDLSMVPHGRRAELLAHRHGNDGRQLKLSACPRVHQLTIVLRVETTKSNPHEATRRQLQQQH